MKIKEISKKNNIHFYKTNKYTSYNICYYFKLENQKKEKLTFLLLTSYLKKTNSIYKTEKDINIEQLKLYGIKLNFSYSNITNNLIGRLEIHMPDPKLVKDNYYEKALEFVSNIIYKPKINNNKLDEKIIDLNKKERINKAREYLITPEAKEQTLSVTNTCLKNTYLKEIYYENIDEFIEIINSIKDSDIINMYNKLLNSSYIGTSIMGNLDNSEIKLLKEKIHFKKVNIDTDYKYPIKLEKQDIKDTDKDIKESTLEIMYQINNLTEKDIPGIIILSMIMNYDSGRLIHKILRDKYNLVYGAYAYFNYRTNTLYFEASIDSKNKNNCIKAMDELMEKLKDEKYLEEEIIKAKKQIKIQDYLMDENKWSMFTKVERKVLNTRNKYITKYYINRVNAKNLIKLVNNLERKVVYLYEGTKEE
jgi:predicted Zn-dependent peptidase